MEHEVITETNTWKGTSIKDICRGKGHWSFAVTPLVPARYHFVLFELPVTLQGPPKVHCPRDKHLWDNDHVRMPFSDKNLFLVTKNNSEFVKERWKIIKEVLAEPITNSHGFEVALNKYNSNLPKFEALHYFFNEEMEAAESEQFFVKLLPKIIGLALQLPELLPGGIPLLKQNYNRSLSMSQLQIACLLANAFLCTFPWKKGTASTYPGVNFVTLFTSFSRPKRKQCICEKLKSICHYFARVTQNTPIGVVTFERKMIPRSAMPRWDKVANNLGNTKIHISSEGTIEDNGLGFLQVDFANSNIGGGVLRYGCVQEEIRFTICPELIISRLFVEQLTNSESVIITGVERYSNYIGYGDTFEWAGDFLDDTPHDVYGRRKITVCVIDATRFPRQKEQFQSYQMIRELNKAYVGFFTREKDNLAPVATGNWGCGAFNGSKQLKTLIQLMACSAANRDLVYYSFGDEDLMENFYNFNSFIGNNQITVAQLWRFLNQFALTKLEDDKLYSYIQQSYFDSKSQPTITKFFSPTKEQGRSLAPSTSFDKNTSKIPLKINPKNDTYKHAETMDIIEQTLSLSSSSSSEDLIPSTPPDPRRINKATPQKKSKDVVSKFPKTDILEIFDSLDGNGNRSKNSTPDSGVSSTSEALSIIDKFIKSTKESPGEVVTVHEENMEVEVAQPGQQSPPKTKITDFFSKVNK